MSAVLTINDADIEREVINSDLPVLIDFFADWCAPCKTMSPRIEKLAGEMIGALKVVQIDVDANPMAVQMFRIQAMPTFVIVKDRQIVDVAQGAMDASALEQFVAPHAARRKGAVEVWDTKRLKTALEVRLAVPVDLREPAHFSRAHIPAAVNLPAATVDGAFADLAATRQTFVFYDRTNDGVAEVAKRAAAAGVKAATLDGGMLSWEADFMRIERGGA